VDLGIVDVVARCDALVGPGSGRHGRTGRAAHS
jgi:hypothetical protein